MEIIGSKMEKLRKAKKLSQKQLAEQAQISQSAVHYIEKGERSPTIYTLSRLAYALGVEIYDLL